VFKSILWHSNSPITLTGYGMQTAQFVPRFKTLGYDVVLNCPMSLTTAPIEWNGVPMLGAAGDPLGNDLLPRRAGEVDLTITLCDLFGLFPCSPSLAGKKIAHWMPVDCDPMGEKDIAALRATGGVPVAMSRFGERMLRNEGFDPLYVPHGINTSVFRPDPEARARNRAGLGISDSTFVVGMACVNKPDSRKGIDQQFQAFAAFHREHPDSVLLMHSMAHGGWDLRKIALNLGFNSALMLVDEYRVASQMITEQDMVAFYNCLDLYSGCSEAEGFGLPVLEAQACGTPAVVTEYSAMAELCASGWKTGGQRHWVGGHESWWMTPDVGAIRLYYEQAYQRARVPALRRTVRDFAVQYDTDTVMDQYWKPALDEIEARYATHD
jgi:glycosyltransferase involved in cell wall biosynthesis